MKKLIVSLLAAIILAACGGTTTTIPTFLTTIDQGDTITLIKGEIEVTIVVNQPDSGLSTDIHNVTVNDFPKTRCPTFWDYKLGDLDPSFEGIFLRSKMANLEILVDPGWELKTSE
ncbi:hypothetical protein KA111_01435 [Candidatus Woesebacteria bacterium]|nr:hypothetical protein [Candidatus Woesebacteria bacterium]